MQVSRKEREVSAQRPQKSFYQLGVLLFQTMLPKAISLDNVPWRPLRFYFATFA